MSDSGRTSLGRRVLSASIAVGAAHALFKLAGLIQAKAMGHYLPAAAFDAVYVFAFENCIFSLFLVGEEVLGPSCMPVFMRELDSGGERQAWRFASILLTFHCLLLMVVVPLLMLFPGEVVSLFTRWSPHSNPEAFAAGARSVRNLAPALFGLSLGSTTYVLLNGHERFFLAAFGDAVWKFAAVAGLVVGVHLLRADQAGTVLVWGLIAGSVLKLGTHLIGLRDKLRLVRPSLDGRNAALRRMLWLALPLLVGILFAKVREIVNNVHILSDIDMPGLMQANSMGRKLQGTLHLLVPYTLSIAVFPYFCKLVDRSDHAGLGDFITRAGRQLLAIFIPAAAVIAALALPLTHLVFAGGQFDDRAVLRTAVSMACYTLVLPAAAIEALAMQAFFANRRMVAVTVLGIVFSSLSMAISWLGLKLWPGRELWLLAAIAGGFTLSRSLKSAALVVVLRSRTPLFPAAATTVFLLRVLLASAAAAGVAWYAGQAAAGFADGRVADLLHLGAGGGGALVTGLAGYWLLRVREPFDLVRWLLGSRRRPAG